LVKIEKKETLYVQKNNFNSRSEFVFIVGHFCGGSFPANRYPIEIVADGNADDESVTDRLAENVAEADCITFGKPDGIGKSDCFADGFTDESDRADADSGSAIDSGKPD